MYQLYETPSIAVHIILVIN